MADTVNAAYEEGWEEGWKEGEWKGYGEGWDRGREEITHKLGDVSNRLDTRALHRLCEELTAASNGYAKADVARRIVDFIIAEVEE